MEGIQRITVGKKRLKDYERLLPGGLFKEIQDLAKELEGIRVIHVNATPDGGGVAEILRGLVPLFYSSGIRAEWYVLKGDLDFFRVTKKIHNLLQGKRGKLSEREKGIYIDTNRLIGEELSALEADVVCIHDPQPLAAISFLHNAPRNVIHLHIDLSKPNKSIMHFLEPMISSYKKVVVSLPEYGEGESWKDRRIIIPPAIDPLNAKNIPMREERAREIVRSLGVNPDKQILLHIMRFDHWKDPLATLRAHRMLKKKFTGLQTVLMGFNAAQDDTEAAAVYKEIRDEALRLQDIFLFFDMNDARSNSIDAVVSAFLTCATAVIHKSIREGFGLVVTEAMWKGKAVVGGNVGGIRYQIQNGTNGFLVSDADEAAVRIESLLRDPLLARNIGEKARMHVRGHFLLPRMLRDYLKLFKNIGMPLARFSQAEQKR